jgi:hypothetical protein
MMVNVPRAVRDQSAPGVKCGRSSLVTFLDPTQVAADMDWVRAWPSAQAKA